MCGVLTALQGLPKGLYFYFIFYCCSVTVVPIFLPIALPCPVQLPLPKTFPTPLSLCMSPLYLFLVFTLLLLSPVISFPPPLWLLSVCSLFHVSGSILLTCLFGCLGFTYRWDHMVFVFFTTWLISLSIMLSSSIHAVMKGRSSFSLSAA